MKKIALLPALALLMGLSVNATHEPGHVASEEEKTVKDDKAKADEESEGKDKDDMQEEASQTSLVNDLMVDLQAIEQAPSAEKPGLIDMAKEKLKTAVAAIRVDANNMLEEAMSSDNLAALKAKLLSIKAKIQAAMSHVDGAAKDDPAMK